MPKKNILLNLNLFSGSSERLRNGLRRTYSISNDGKLLFDPEAFPIFVESLKTNNTKTPVGEKSIFPSLRLTNRIVGNNEAFVNDEEWKTFWIGGSYGNKLYLPFYNSKFYYDHSNTLSLPYVSTETKHLVSQQPDISISGEYFKLYRNYQSNITNNTDILTLPNFYSIPGDLLIPQEEEDYMFTYKYKKLNDYFEEYFTTPRQRDLKNKNIFVSDLRNIINTRNSQVKEENSPYTLRDGDLNKIFSLMPFGTKVELDEAYVSQGGDEYKNYFARNGLENLLLRTVKETFLAQANIQTENVDLVSNTEYLKGYEKISYNNVFDTKQATFKTIKLQNLLMNSFKNPSAVTTDMSFIEQAIAVDKSSYLSALDTTGIYRTDNVKKTLLSMSFLRERMSNLLSEIDKLDRDVLNDRTQKNYYEPLIYRIEKKGGSPTGDNRNDTTLQNIWFFNRGEAIEYFDSQIKYNTNYTYKIYSYVIIEGLKYQTTNLSITKLIATDDPEGGLGNCLEFYDPYTSFRSEQLFSSENISNTTGADGQVINQLASNSQINSTHRYIADFYMDLESDIRLVEIPLMEKKINIIDHPTNKVIVEPNYYRDNSKKVAFLLKNDVFNYDYLTYPTTVSPIDDQNRDLYLQNKDMIITDKLKERTVSDIRTIECFRLDSKPQSYKDFNNAFKTIIDLKDRNTGDIYSDSLLVQQVIPNKKYYYTFRSVNENGISGHLSPIYETILVSDGGYNYATFKQIYEEELIENRASKISIPIKKLLNIVPNFRHLQINFSDLNYSEKSHEQIDRVVLGKDIEEPIWDNSFKFRLTSEKTKRVFDINIHFDKK